jgi:uncharacterized protein YqeY
MREHEAAIARTAARLFGSGEVDDARAELWDALRESGFAHPFHAGAKRFAEGALILAHASRHAPGVPLAENIVGSYVLSAYGEPLDMRRVTWADPLCSTLRLQHGSVHGLARFVPHAAVSSHVLADVSGVDGVALVCIEMRAVEGHASVNAAGEPRDELTFRGAPARVLRSGLDGPSELLWLGALARAVQMTSLCQRVVERCVEHAELARAATVAQTAVSEACRAVDEAGPASHTTARRVAMAKIEATRAANLAIAVSDAVHGAAGDAPEHPIDRFTRRLMSYRAELGDERFHARFLATQPNTQRKPHMDLKEKLTHDLKDAMRAKDQLRLDTIRSIRAAVTQREVDGQKELSEAEIHDLVRTLRKQRNEAIEQYRTGGREDLAEKEERERTILETYLPAAPDAAAMEAAVRAVIAETGASSPRDMGKVMQAVKERLSGADGKVLSALVKQLLSGS